MRATRAAAASELEAKLTAVNKRRTAIEERFAERDRERTQLWGRLTALRATHERLSVRAESLATRQADLAAGLERRRDALGALAAESAEPAEGEDPIELELGRIEVALGGATEALVRARGGDGDVVDELTEGARGRRARRARPPAARRGCSAAAARTRSSAASPPRRICCRRCNRSPRASPRCATRSGAASPCSRSACSAPATPTT